MPLDKSCSKQAVSNNIKAEKAAGKSQAQSVAIAMSVKEKCSSKKKGK